MPARPRARLHLLALEDRATPAMAPFAEPPVLASSGGVLKATLNQTVGPAVVGDRAVTNAWTYNGTYAGPTLMVKPGDLLDLTVNNTTPEPTNLHTHGLHVSPLGDGDNVLLRIDPGEDNHYRIEIPADHPEGLYWYHPHHHGQVNDQIARGLSGLIVIGRADGGAPQLDGRPQRLLALKNAQLDGTSIVVPSGQDVSGQVFTVNGQLNPVLTAPPGQSQVLNIANIGNNAFYLLQLVNEAGTQIRLPAVGLDGNPFNAVGNPGGDPNLLGMPPGRRWSVVIPGGAAGEVWRLQTLGFNDGFHQWPAATLMTLTFAGPAVPPPPPVTALTPPNYNFVDLRNATVAARRTVVFDQGPDAQGNFIFTINGGAFPDNPVFRPRIGTVEEWTLLNRTSDIHPFHYHVNPSQVVSAQNQPTGIGRYSDVINVPAANPTTGVPGRTVIRIAFEDFLGTTVYHCHRVDHEDDGMMALVDMVPNVPAFAVGANAGGAAARYNAIGNAPLGTAAPFGAGFAGGVRVATGDVNYDGVMDAVYAAGPGGGPRVLVVSGATGQPLMDFFAYDPGFAGGVFVATGDVNADGYADVITGPGAGGGPNVRAFSGKDGSLVLSFFAYAPSFAGGVTVAAGNVDGNGRTEVITGAGPGGGPHVKSFRVEHDHAGGSAVHAHEQFGFMAFDPSFRGGVMVAVGWVLGTGFPDIIVGAGSGGGPEVNVYNITSEHDGVSGGHGGAHDHAADDFRPSAVLARSFFAFDPNFRGGVSVGSQIADVGDNLLVGAGPGGGPLVNVYGIEGGFLQSFFAFDPALRGGVMVS